MKDWIRYKYFLWISRRVEKIDNYIKELKLYKKRLNRKLKKYWKEMDEYYRTTHLETYYYDNELRPPFI